MKTEYKHIRFEDISYMYPGRKTSVWICINSKDIILGDIRWEGPWRQYCYYPKDRIVLAKSCLLDICDFITQLQVCLAWKNTKKKYQVKNAARWHDNDKN